MLKYWIKKSTIWLWYFIASFIILIAVMSVAVQALTPIINHHKHDIEKYASNLFHVNVHIDSVRADWARLGPEVHFTGLTLTSQKEDRQTTIFQADDVSIQLGVLGTLWHRSPYFSSIKVSGSHIDIQETEKNRFSINHALEFDLSDSSVPQSPSFISWLITQNTIRLSRITVDIHRLQGDTVFADLSKMSVYQSANGKDNRRLSVFIDGRISAIKSGDSIRKIETQISLYSWIDFFQGAIKFIECEFLNQNVTVQQGKSVLHHPSIEGLLLWQPLPNQNGSWMLQGKNIVFTKATQETEDYEFELWKLPDHYALSLNALNISELLSSMDFFDLMPTGFDFKKAKIQGKVEDVTLYVPVDFSALNHYVFSGRFSDVHSLPYGEFPGLQHLNAAVSGNLTEGSFILIDKDDHIDFPLYFYQPISVKNVFVKGGWKHEQNMLLLFGDVIKISTPDVLAEGGLTLKMNSSSSVFMSLLGEYRLSHSEAITQLLPMKQFDAEFAQWLKNAVQTGSGSDGKVLIRGLVDDFPYSQNQGVFIVDGSIKPVKISFSPEWPPITNAVGQLLIRNQTLDISIAGNTDELAIASATVHVPDYSKDQVLIQVDGTMTADASEYLHYVQKSPLQASLGQWLKPFTVTGKGQLLLHLDLPLGQLDQYHIGVSGQWLTQQASFAWNVLQASLKNIAGVIYFTQDSIDANHLSATLANEPIHISIHSQKKKNTMSAIDIDAQGRFSVSQLRTLFQLDNVSTYLTGSSPYQAHLSIPISSTEYIMSFQSDLRGIMITLPQPLGKTLKESLPLSVEAIMNPAKDWVRIAVHYAKNNDLTAILQHYFQQNPDQRRLDINLHATTFSWPLSIILPSSKAGEQPWWQCLSTITLRFDQLSLYNHSFSNVLLSTTQNNGDFLWTIQAKEAKGRAFLSSDVKKPIRVELEYLSLASQSQSLTNSSDLKAEAVASWPEIFVTIQRLTMGKRTFGELILHTSPLPKGLMFNDIEIKNALYQFVTQGQWVNMGQQDVTLLQGRIQTKNTGDFLKENGITQDFKAKAGSVEYAIQWPGSPMSFQLKNIQGDAILNVRDGLIPVSGDAATMGLGKVLTLFSAQSIQRRLKLNFSDLNQDGYSYNELKSELHFQSGQAQVKTGSFDGPEAKIDFKGLVDLIKQSYDLNIVVTPYVTSSLPLIATIAGGPIAGVATYAFDKIAEGSIAKFTSYHYLLVGPWKQPRLIDLDAQAKEKAAARQAKLDERNLAPAIEASS